MRDYLIYYAIEYNGDYKRVLKAMEDKKTPNMSLVNNQLSNLQSKVVTIIDDDYPEKLKEIYCPPLVLFYYGDINLINQKTIGIIGTRDVSVEGKKWTEYFAKEFSDKDNVIVSGMAKGVDAIAHKSAIDSGGRTIAVLGSGIDYCYPSVNRELYKLIKDKHLLISEYPAMTSPNRHHFPMRNRIVANLSDRILITEAGMRSGTMITANWALENGKDVYCVPSIEKNKRGCNYLIKQGAILVDEINDFFT